MATVANGVVTGVAAGTATITASAGNKTASCTVTVTSVTVPVESVSFNTTGARFYDFNDSSDIVIWVNDEQ